MDTDLHQPAPSVAQTATSTPRGDGAGKASAIIGSEAFVDRVLRAMTVAARKAVEENNALETRPAKP